MEVAEKGARSLAEVLGERDPQVRAKVDQETKLQRARRALLREDVLWQVLEQRYRALMTSARQQEAHARHLDFLARSESYDRCFQLGDQRLDGVQGDHSQIAGLTWWVPADEREPNSFADRIARRAWLPLSEILATRELAIGTVAIDIGANIGTTSIPRVVLGDFQYIYAAEPAPANYVALVHNVAANGLQGFVLPDNVALSFYDGEAEMVIRPLMATHQLRLGPPLPHQNVDPRIVKVRCRTLDSWVTSLGIDLDLVTFIKCDTQGWEGGIFRGAGEVLEKKHITWQIEFWPRGLAKAGVTLEEMYGMIQRHFTHFIDIGDRGRGTGPRVRKTAEIRGGAWVPGGYSEGLHEPVALQRFGVLAAAAPSRLLRKHFTHFVDVRRAQIRVPQRISELEEALAYLGDMPNTFTERLLYNADDPW